MRGDIHPLLTLLKLGGHFGKRTAKKGCHIQDNGDITHRRLLAQKGEVWYDYQSPPSIGPVGAVAPWPSPPDAFLEPDTMSSILNNSIAVCKMERSLIYLENKQWWTCKSDWTQQRLIKLIIFYFLHLRPCTSQQKYIINNKIRSL